MTVEPLDVLGFGFEILAVLEEVCHPVQGRGCAVAALDNALLEDTGDAVPLQKVSIIGLKFIGRNELLRAVVRDADQAKKVRIWFAAAAY